MTEGKLRRAMVLAPMTSELRPLVKLARARPAEIGGVRLYQGRVAGIEVVITRIGVGPGPARRSTERVLGVIDVDHVLVSGVAGGLAPHLPIGTAVVPEMVLDHRNGNRYESHPMDGVVRQGLVATTDEVLLDPERLAELSELGVVAVEMESAGVAEACVAAGLPWTTFRVVSDRPDDHLVDSAVVSLLNDDGTANVRGAMRLVARQPHRIPALVRLARDSSNAASGAARAALSALGWAP